jgi:hypothetical protein
MDGKIGDMTYRLARSKLSKYIRTDISQDRLRSVSTYGWDMHWHRELHLSKLSGAVYWIPM